MCNQLKHIANALYCFYNRPSFLQHTRLPDGEYDVYVPLEVDSLAYQIGNIMFLKLRKNNKNVTFSNLFTSKVDAKMTGKYVFTDLPSSGRTDRHEIFKLNEYYLLKVTSQDSTTIRHFICIPVS